MASKSRHRNRLAPQVTRDVIPFGANNPTVFPSTGQAEVIRRLASDMKDAQVFVEVLWRCCNAVSGKISSEMFPSDNTTSRLTACSSAICIRASPRPSPRPPWPCSHHTRCPRSNPANPIYSVACVPPHSEIPPADLPDCPRLPRSVVEQAYRASLRPVEAARDPVGRCCVSGIDRWMRCRSVNGRHGRPS